jgi:hypothetical protein
VQNAVVETADGKLSYRRMILGGVKKLLKAK